MKLSRLLSCENDRCKPIRGKVGQVEKWSDPECKVVVYG